MGEWQWFVWETGSDLYLTKATVVCSLLIATRADSLHLCVREDSLVELRGHRSRVIEPAWQRVLLVVYR